MSLLKDKVYKDRKECALAICDVHKDCRTALDYHRQTLFPRWLRNFYGKNDPSQFGNAAGEFDLDRMTCLPWAYQQVNIITGQLRQALSEADPIARLRAESADGDEPKTHPLQALADQNQEWINCQMQRHVMYPRQLKGWLVNAAITGTQWLFLDWFYPTGATYGRMQDPLHADRKKFGRLPRASEAKQPKGRMRVTPVNSTDIFPDPLAKGMDERTCSFPARFIDRQFWMPIDMLARFIRATPTKNWVVLKDAEENHMSLEDYLSKTYEATVRPGDDIWRTTLSQVSRPADIGSSASGTLYQRLVRLLDHWENDRHVLLAMTGDTAGNALLIEGPDSHPYRNIGIPFRPIRLMEMPDELWGLGIVWAISDLVHQANVWFNLRNMHLAKLAGPIILCNNLAGMYADDLTNLAGMPIDLKGNMPLSNSLIMQEYPDTTKGLIAEIDWIYQQVQVTAGATDYSMGRAQEGFNNTVRGMAMIGEQLNIRKGEMAIQAANDVGYLVEGMMGINQQYVLEDEQFAITGKDGKPDLGTVTADAIERGYQVSVDVRPIATNKAMRAQQHTNLAQIFSKSPQWNVKTAILSAYRAIDEPHPEAYLNEMVDSPDNPDAENAFHEATQRSQMPPVRNWHNHPNHIVSHNAWITANGADPEAVGHIEQHFIFAGLAQPSQPASPVNVRDMSTPQNQQQFGKPEGQARMIPGPAPAAPAPSPVNQTMPMAGAVR